MNKRRHTDPGKSAQRAAWMARAQQGDGEAYRTLLDDIGPLVAHVLGRRLADPADAEDAYQETFFALHRARHTYEPSRPLEPWLLAIAKNVAADFGRRNRRRALREVLMEVLPEQVVQPTRDMRTRFQSALAGLPTTQRDALVMLKLDGLSVAQAAAKVGTSPGALKVRAHRAHSTIRAMLAP